MKQKRIERITDKAIPDELIHSSKASVHPRVFEIRSERDLERDKESSDHIPIYSRASRTRTLIQLGGLLDKAGLATAFDIALGDDLQRDEHTFDPAATLLGALLELKVQLQGNGQDDNCNVNQMKLWRLKGKKALME